MIFATVARSLLNLLYPPTCLHCQKGLSIHSHLLCRECIELMEYIDPLERCTKCFSSHKEESVCFLCRKYSTPLKACAAAFPYEGPSVSLIRQLKYGQQTYLTKGIAGFMLKQWITLEWPMPDLVVSVPQSTSHWLERGFNQSELIGKEFARGIEKPFALPLLRVSGDYSQAGLKKDQRKKLSNNRFIIKKPEILRDKTVLLIDDVSTTGATIKQCASVMAYAGPKAIYALTFLKA